MRGLAVAASNADGSGTRTLKFTSIARKGVLTGYNLVDVGTAPSGTTLTLAMLVPDVLVSTGPANTIVVVPTLASLGITWDSSNPVYLKFIVQRQGTGLLYVNPGSGVTAVYLDFDPATLPQWGMAAFMLINTTLVAC